MLHWGWVEQLLKNEKELSQILGKDEEYFITDYEAPFSICEYENLEKLNCFVAEFSGLNDHDQQKVIYLINDCGVERDEALQQYEDVTFYEGMTLKDVAYELVNEGSFGDIPETIKSYIDYEKLANDLSVDGYYETSKGTFYVS
jgi:antirestriction protein